MQRKYTVLQYFGWRDKCDRGQPPPRHQITYSLLSTVWKLNHVALHQLVAAEYIAPIEHIQGGPKDWHHFLYALTSWNINWFSKFFHCQNQEKIRNDTITKDPTTPQVCRYTTLWNVSVLKATIETGRLL